MADTDQYIFPVVEIGSLNFIVNGAIVGSVNAGGHFGELALIYDGTLYKFEHCCIVSD